MVNIKLTQAKVTLTLREEIKMTFQRPKQHQLDFALQNLTAVYASDPDVCGIDVGFKWINGQPTSDICARIHLRGDAGANVTGPASPYPSEICGVPVVLIDADYTPAPAKTGNPSAKDNAPTIVDQLLFLDTDAQSTTARRRPALVAGLVLNQAFPNEPGAQMIIDGRGFYRVNSPDPNGMDRPTDIVGFRLVRAELFGDTPPVPAVENGVSSPVALKVALGVDQTNATVCSIACDIDPMLEHLNISPHTFEVLVHSERSRLTNATRVPQNGQAKMPMSPPVSMGNTGPLNPEIPSPPAAGTLSNRHFVDSTFPTGRTSVGTPHLFEDPRTDDLRPPTRSVKPRSLGRDVSIERDIWPSLHRALTAHNPTYQKVQLTDSFSKHHKGNVVCAVQKAINKSPEFFDDGIILEIKELKGTRCYADVCRRLAKIYKGYGHDIRD